MSKNKKVVWLALSIMTLYHLLSGYIIQWSGSNDYNLYVRPTISIVLIIVLLKLPRQRHGVSLKNHFAVSAIPVVAVIIFNAVYLSLGALEGFGKNPFDISPSGIIYNVIVFYPYYIALEMLRERLVKTLRKPERSALYLGLITLVLSFLHIGINGFEVFWAGDFKGIVEYIGGTIFPMIALNVLLTTIVMISGAKIAIIVKLIYESIYFVLPILPNIQWLTKAFLAVVFALTTVSYYKEFWQNKEQRLRRKRDRLNLSSLTTGMTFASSIAIIWFALGVFPVFPTLVLTGSMEPFIYSGDIVLIQRVTPEEISVGDIIQFRADNYDIIHRVIARDDHELTTKGDNNNAIDPDTVNTGFVRGKYLYHIPYLGKIPLYIRTQFNQKELELVRQKYDTGE